MFAVVGPGSIQNQKYFRILTSLVNVGAVACVIDPDNKGTFFESNKFSVPVVEKVEEAVAMGVSAAVLGRCPTDELLSYSEVRILDSCADLGVKIISPVDLSKVVTLRQKKANIEYQDKVSLAVRRSAVTGKAANVVVSCGFDSRSGMLESIFTLKESLLKDNPSCRIHTIGTSFAGSLVCDVGVSFSKVPAGLIGHVLMDYVSYTSDYDYVLVEGFGGTADPTTAGIMKTILDVVKPNSLLLCLNPNYSYNRFGNPVNDKKVLLDQYKYIVGPEASVDICGIVSVGFDEYKIEKIEGI